MSNEERDLSDLLWCDLQSDDERARFIESGLAEKTGVIAPAMTDDVAKAFRDKSKDTHALAVFLDDETLGFDEFHVRTFQSKRDAEKWAVDRICEHDSGWTRLEDGRVQHQGSNGRDHQVYNSDEEAMNDWSWGLGDSEYFHVYAINNS